MGRVGRIVGGALRGAARLGRGILRAGKSLVTKALSGGLKFLGKLGKFALPLAGMLIPGLGLAGMLGNLGGMGGLFGGLGNMGSMFGGLGSQLGSTFGGLFGGNPLTSFGLDIGKSFLSSASSNQQNYDSGAQLAVPYMLPPQLPMLASLPFGAGGNYF